MPTKLIGILNLTPDSFSDGGKYTDPLLAINHARALASLGACAIDIGAESTRPGATPLSHKEEWARLEPVLRNLKSALPDTLISVDTYHPENAAKALEHGMDWINDVSGFINPAMIEAVKNSPCKLVMMHSLGAPVDKNVTLPEAADPVEHVAGFFKRQLAALEAAGIARERIILDAGIGFGKTPAQSLALIQRIKELKVLGLPLLVGHSRKSFLEIHSLRMSRDEATLYFSKQLIADGVDYLRVHDVAAHQGFL